MGRQLAFDGFLRVAGLPRTGDQLLPPLAKDQPVAPLALTPTQHFTQPPPRYTEAGLVKALEAESIGRPSTYAAIITTIQDRQYVELVERSFRPTDLGLAVTDKLVKHFPKEFDVRFTAHMEDQLDKIEEAHADWVAVLEEFYRPFAENLKKAGEEMTHAKAETTPSEYKCETCGKPMVYRFSKNGRYLACTGYPECKSTHPVDREGKKVARVEVDVACPLCGKKMILRRSRFGEFLSCSGYPECTGSLKLDRAGNVKPPSPPPLEVDVVCPKCQSKLYLRRSKRGPWLGCSKYPKCRGRLAWSALPEEQQKDLTRRLEEHEHAHPMPDLKKADGTLIVGAMNAATGQVSDKPAGAREAGVNCPKCGKPMVIRAGKRGDFLACSGYPKCRNALNLDSLPDLQRQQEESATPKP
jgi:DNA topoisomerase-1